jgi:pre-mRNA-splicing factor ISY1
VPNPSGRGPGYRYFGAARKLPGVRELFDKPPEIRKRRTRYEIHKRINAGYYGYYDDEDGVLEPLEAAAEKRMRKEVVEEWHRVERVRREAMKGVVSGEVVTAGGHSGEAARVVLFEGVEEEVEEERKLEEEQREREKVKEAGREFVAHVPLPDEKEIERMVLERKKKELLSKYASDSLQVEQEEAKEMLNVHR